MSKDLTAVKTAVMKMSLCLHPIEHHRPNRKSKNEWKVCKASVGMVRYVKKLRCGAEDVDNFASASSEFRTAQGRRILENRSPAGVLSSRRASDSHKGSSLNVLQKGHFNESPHAPKFAARDEHFYVMVRRLGTQCGCYFVLSV